MNQKKKNVEMYLYDRSKDLQVVFQSGIRPIKEKSITIAD